MFCPKGTWTKKIHKFDTVSQRTCDKYFLFFSLASNREIDEPVGKKYFSGRYEGFAVKPQTLHWGLFTGLLGLIKKFVWSASLEKDKELVISGCHRKLNIITHKSQSEAFIEENKKTELRLYSSAEVAELLEQREYLRNSCVLITPIIPAITTIILGQIREADLRWVF